MRENGDRWNPEIAGAPGRIRSFFDVQSIKSRH